MKSPPVAPLLDAVARLESHGVACALGGSGLLAALGLADEVRDWDLTTDAPLERVRAALAGLETAYHCNDALHADEKLQVAGGTVEIIVGFAFHVKGAVVRVPTIVASRRDGVPLGSAECWAVAYALLGRAPKSEALFERLRREGADAAVVRRLLLEPLPGELAARLAALAS